MSNLPSAAWGWGLLLTLILVVADTMPSSTVLPRPGVGRPKCFLQDQAQGVYLHAPIALLMLVNGVFFIITTRTLYRCGSLRNLLTFRRSNNNNSKARNSRQKTRKSSSLAVSSGPSRINQETKEQLVRKMRGAL